jgi:hypothetical protein
MEKGVIDLNFEDEQLRFNYPMIEPITFLLGKNFLQKGQIVLNFVIMIEIGKKYKKIAKGDLKLLTKYFLDGKNIYENWINIKPFQRQLENLGVHFNSLKDDLNSGKIYSTIELKESPADYQKKVLLYAPSSNEQKENVVEVPKRQFDDNLSDVSISIVETKEEDREGLELEQFIEYEYIEGLKLLLQNDYKNILPNDFVKLKQLNEILYGKFIDLSNAYNETLYSLSSINEEIRQQAKKYYDEYKLLKKDVYNGRIDLKKQNDQLQLEIQNNNKENQNIKQEIDNYISNKKQFKSQLGIVDKDNKTLNKNNVDLNMLTDVLKKISDMGYDIFKNSNLNEEELKLIEDTLNIKSNADNNMNNQNKNNESNNKKKENLIDSAEAKEEVANNLENNMNMNEQNKDMNMDAEGKEDMNQEKKDMNEEEYENDEDMKEDLELGNQVVSLIEKDVNELYLKKIIEQINIDQINAITYAFENEKGDLHEITLKIVDDELYCVDGTKFSDWLIKNFSSSS